uniref:Uncharacterized protein n=1 Tax=Kalanchoe fedtschenkoi TaxID=63787 RepID=A0A7N0TY48_KALFE
MDTTRPVDKLLNYQTCALDSSTTSTQDMPFVVLVCVQEASTPLHTCTSAYSNDALNTDGYTVLGGYMSPVNDAYENKTGLIYVDSRFKVMLVCGSDLLKSFSIPAVWIPEQIKIICRDFGIVCIHREGEDFIVTDYVFE